MRLLLGKTCCCRKEPMGEFHESETHIPEGTLAEMYAGLWVSCFLREQFAIYYRLTVICL